jgi:hypothetical protein
VRFKVALDLPKLVRFKVGVRLGGDEGARLDLKVKLFNGRPWKWRAMAEPGKPKQLEAAPNDYEGSYFPTGGPGRSEA